MIGTAIQVESLYPSTQYAPYCIQMNENRIQNVGTESRLYMPPGSTQTPEEKQQETDLIKLSYQRFQCQKPEACVIVKHLRAY